MALRLIGRARAATTLAAALTVAALCAVDAAVSCPAGKVLCGLNYSWGVPCYPAADCATCCVSATDGVGYCRPPGYTCCAGGNDLRNIAAAPGEQCCYSSAAGPWICDATYSRCGLNDGATEAQCVVTSCPDGWVACGQLGVYPYEWYSGTDCHPAADCGTCCEQPDGRAECFPLVGSACCAGGGAFEPGAQCCTGHDDAGTAVRWQCDAVTQRCGAAGLHTELCLPRRLPAGWKPCGPDGAVPPQQSCCTEGTAWWGCAKDSRGSAPSCGSSARQCRERPPDCSTSPDPTDDLPAQQCVSGGSGAQSMDVAVQAASFIAAWEAFRSSAYYDPTGRLWTIGYGTTRYRNGSRVSPGDKCSEQEAMDMVNDIVQHMLRSLAARVPGWDSMQLGQQVALLSFSYNTGYSYGNKKFTALNDALAAKSATVCAMGNVLAMYKKSGGNVIKGLWCRRLSEGDLWAQSLAACGLCVQ